MGLTQPQALTLGVLNRWWAGTSARQRERRQQLAARAEADATDLGVQAAALAGLAAVQHNYQARRRRGPARARACVCCVFCVFCACARVSFARPALFTRQPCMDVMRTHALTHVSLLPPSLTRTHTARIRKHTHTPPRTRRTNIKHTRTRTHTHTHTHTHTRTHTVTHDMHATHATTPPPPKGVHVAMVVGHAPHF
jgi:hypothetical protein